MDETTQQNAALVEEAAAAAASMQDQAANLARVVSVFKLDHEPVVARQRAMAQPVSTEARPTALKKEIPATPVRRLAAAQPSESDWEEF